MNKSLKSGMPTDNSSSLRRRAEEKLRTQLERVKKLSARDIQELVHELGTHQIELEMQNEELRKARDELESSRNQYEESVKRTSSILMPVLMGSAVGAGIAFLLAPKSGKEIRKELKRFAADTRDQVADVIVEGRDLYKEGKEVVAGVVKAGKETYDEGTEMIEKLMHKKKERSLVVPILASGIIGAGIALLFAPKSGKEVRGDIKRIAGDARDKVVSAVDDVKVLYVKGKEALPEAVEAGKKAFAHENVKFRHAS